MRNYLIAACFMAAAALPAAPSVASGTAVSEDSADEKADTVICRRNRVIGSRVRTERICLTRKEWVKLENETRADWHEFRKRATAGAPR